MNLLFVLGIGDAFGATVDKISKHPNVLSMIWLPLLIILIFYFLLIRPQTKRAKEQKSTLDKLAVGDEIMSTGGILAKVTHIGDNFVVLEISRDVEITMQKSSIASVLPKGTLDSILL